MQSMLQCNPCCAATLARGIDSNIPLRSAAPPARHRLRFRRQRPAWAKSTCGVSRMAATMVFSGQGLPSLRGARCYVSRAPTFTNEAKSRRRVVVLGSTGSIGTNCLEVIAHLEDRLQAVGL